MRSPYLFNSKEQLLIEIGITTAMAHLLTLYTPDMTNSPLNFPSLTIRLVPGNAMVGYLLFGGPPLTIEPKWASNYVPLSALSQIAKL